MCTIAKTFDKDDHVVDDADGGDVDDANDDAVDDDVSGLAP